MSADNGQERRENVGKDYMSNESRISALEIQMQHAATHVDFARTQTFVMQSESRTQDRIAKTFTDLMNLIAETKAEIQGLPLKMIIWAAILMGGLWAVTKLVEMFFTAPSP
ncbi:MAG: hypothetical protein OXG03_02765 [Gammaproteobacteria bacterium]|nr:hypothetical protein [Gammaproteobacteria bacterium]